MKRLVITLFVALLSLPAFAAGPDRDMLLSPRGTLFTVESDPVENHPGVRAASTRLISLTVQQGSSETTSIVPESLTYGVHSSPALAYDSASDTLFVFWEKAPNRMSSQLVFCSYRDGRWSAPQYIDSSAFEVRKNLRLAVTRRTQTIGGAMQTEIPELTLHAVWWEETGAGEAARYAMLSIDNGNVFSIEIRDLSSFMTMGSGALQVVGQYREMFRHPAVFESPSKTTVEVIFGDVNRNSFFSLTLRPVANGGRIRTPVGVRLRDIPAPAHAPDSDARISTMMSDENISMHYLSGNRLNYLLYKNGRWSEAQSVSINERVSASAAVDALRRMLSTE